MMIALVILGFGLLVVGAALPVGLKYTKDTIDRDTGDAAGQYGLNLIEQSVRLSRAPWDSSAGHLRHYEDIFRPRDATPGVTFGELLMDPVPLPPGLPARQWEPIIKVRPLLAVGINASPGDTANYGRELWPPGGWVGSSPSQDVEERIARWLATINAPTWKSWPRVEHDAYDPPTDGWVAPALPSVAAVYPPISADTRFLPSSFLPPHQYDLWPVNGPTGQGAETHKAMDRRVSWTAFCRRASYAPGSDPQLYEVVVVATRLAADGQRYPRFNAALGGYGIAGTKAAGSPLAGLSYKSDSATAVPWLVAFQGLPTLAPVPYDPNDPDRPITDPNYVDPPTLRFLANADTGRLVPPGSVLIPAVNDDRPSALNPLPGPPVRWAGFVPHAPNALPIYEVIDRSENTDGTDDIIVKNNGFYPWVDTVHGATAANWPVWVIPPAFKELDANGNPVYENHSPIVGVARRYIRFREIP